MLENAAESRHPAARCIGWILPGTVSEILSYHSLNDKYEQAEIH